MCSCLNVCIMLKYLIYVKHYHLQNILVLQIRCNNRNGPFTFYSDSVTALTNRNIIPIYLDVFSRPCVVHNNCHT